MAADSALDSKLVDEMLSHLKPADCIDYEPESRVASFYANRSVFITGATGFIGKALVEKLLRSCRDIKRIYLLIREKRGKDVNERLRDLLEAQIFEQLKSLPGGRELLEEKLRSVRGDITLAGFGISEEDMAELSAEISIVFNSAATIRFVEPIDVAVRNNIYSVEQLFEFCDRLQGLQALVHLSTAYSNCHKRDTIYEIFYEPPMRGPKIIGAIQKLKQVEGEIHLYPTLVSDGHQEEEESAPQRSACKPQRFYSDYQLVERAAASLANGVPPGKGAGELESSRAPSAGDDLLADFTRISLRRTNRPNTYTFTKAISESYLLELARARPGRYLDEGIPIAVVRPSIVGGAWREPAIGLVDNFNGPTGAVLSLYTGALQAMPGKGDKVADLVPVDMVANMVICTGWYLAGESREPQRRPGGQVKRDQGAFVFNFVSGYRNPLYWRQFTETIAELAYRYPSRQLVRLPSSFFIRAGPLYELYDLLNQRLPAWLQDFVRAKLLRLELTSRSSAMAAYSRIKQMTDTLTPFTSNQWRLSDANVCALYGRLDERDRHLFQFDVKAISWPHYIRSYVIGARLYTLRDEARNVPGAARLLARKLALSRISVVLVALLLYYFVGRQSGLETLALAALGL